MTVIRSTFLGLAKTVSLFLLATGTVGCFLVSYSYISGDRTDRDDMQAAVSHLASSLRVLPDAQAEESEASLGSFDSKK
jgi:hypothetical protein